MELNIEKRVHVLLDKYMFFVKSVWSVFIRRKKPEYALHRVQHPYTFDSNHRVPALALLAYLAKNGFEIICVS